MELFTSALKSTGKKHRLILRQRTAGKLHVGRTMGDGLVSDVGIRMHKAVESTNRLSHTHIIREEMVTHGALWNNRP
jgi:hypothetical protein